MLIASIHDLVCCCNSYGYLFLVLVSDLVHDISVDLFGYHGLQADQKVTGCSGSAAQTA